MVGEIERVLAALERAQVRYLVVGGVAVVLHGRALRARLRETEVSVVPLRDLIALKRDASRPVDREDVERLRELEDDEAD